MDAQHHSMEDLIEHGPEGMLAAFTAAYNMGMKIERERFIGAGRYERAEGCRAFANGYKPKRIDTPAGTATLSVPKTARHGDTPFYSKALQRGRCCKQAVIAAAATMYLKGVSTRDVEDVLAVMGVEGISATQVSNATKGLDEELERRCTLTGSSATPPSSRRSASCPTAATRPSAGGACWRCPSRSRRRRSTGASSSTASSHAACAW